MYARDLILDTKTDINARPGNGNRSFGGPRALTTDPRRLWPCDTGKRRPQRRRDRSHGIAECRWWQLEKKDGSNRPREKQMSRQGSLQI